jgi:hypothetical protein
MTRKTWNPEDADLLAIDRYLKEAAAATRAEARLADPHQLLWRAELRARVRAAERAVRPIALCRNLALGASAVTGAALLASGDLPVGAAFRRFLDLAPGLGASLGISVISAAALGVLWLYSSWVEG